MRARREPEAMLARVLAPLTAVTAVLARAIDLATGLMLAAIVAIGGLELIARNLFNHSFVWAHEVTILLANWVYFLGICMVYERRGDVTVDLVPAFMGPRLRRIWSALCHVVSAALFATIAWYGWELVKLQAPFRTSGLGIPNPAFSAPVMIGAVVLAMLCLRHALTALAEDREATSAAAPV